MGVNVKKMRKKAEDLGKGNDLWTPDEGIHKLYLMPPCRDDDKHEPTADLNFIPVVQHYGLGDGGKSACVCLDADRNPIVKHPFVVAALKKKGIKLQPKKGCPVCKALEAGDFAESQAETSRPQERYLWRVIPIGFRKTKRAKKWGELAPAPAPTMCGKSIHGGYLEAFVDNDDVSDPDAAVYVILTRTGTGMKTRYEIKTDLESAKKPVKLGKKLKRLIAKSDKEHDLFDIVAGFIRSFGDIEALLANVKVEDDDDDDDGGSGGKTCEGQYDEDDEECTECEKRKKCKKASGADDSDDDDDDDEDPDDEDPDEDPDDEDPDDDDDDEDSDNGDDDDSDDDPDDDSDDDDSDDDSDDDDDDDDDDSDSDDDDSDDDDDDSDDDDDDDDDGDDDDDDLDDIEAELKARAGKKGKKKDPPPKGKGKGKKAEEKEPKGKKGKGKKKDPPKKRAPQGAKASKGKKGKRGKNK